MCRSDVFVWSCSSVNRVANDFSSIGEVLALLLEEFPDVTISKIRFLESQGLIAPERTTAGYRKFTTEEIERLRFILREQKDNFLPLRVIRDRLEGETSDSLLRPDDITDPSMPRGIRVPSQAHPASRRPAARPAVVAGTKRAKQGAERFTRAEILDTTGVQETTLAALEKIKLVRPRMLGREAVYSETDRDIVHLAGRLTALGLEPRVLMQWRLAAEREADVVTPLVARVASERRDGAADDAAKLLEDLLSLGAELRAALLHSLTRDLRDHD